MPRSLRPLARFSAPARCWSTRALLAASLLLGPVGCSPPPGTGVDNSAIIGGVTDANDPSVVLVIASNNQGESLCTGEVVSPHVVLTAAHCVDPATVGNGVTFQIFLGADYNNPAQANNAANYVAVQATHYDTRFNQNVLDGGHDVGVVITKTALPRTPLPMNHSALTQNDIGQVVRLVGFGISNGNDTNGTTAGTKRQVSTAITSVDSLFLGFGDARHNTCEGDSGGPAFLPMNGVETIVGITSFGDQGCTMGGYDSRVDDYAATFVDPYIMQVDGQLPQGPPGPVDMAMAQQPSPPVTPVDLGHAAPPDLERPPQHPSNTPDMALATSGKGTTGTPAAPGALGAACTHHDDCASHICALIGETGYCTAPCALTAANPCPTGYACTVVDGTTELCLAVTTNGVTRGASGGCSVTGAGQGAGTTDPLAWAGLVGMFGWVVGRARRRASHPRE